MLLDVFVPQTRIGTAFFSAIFVSGLLLTGPVAAQDTSGISPDQIKQMMQNLSPEQQQKAQQLQQQMQGGAAQLPQSSSQTPIVLNPDFVSGQVPRSGLEKAMSNQAGTVLRQFGYDQVGVGRSVSIPQTGALQDNYVLGPGDEIDVTLRGQENSQFSATVDRNGQVVLPRLSPIAAAGRTFSEFRKAVQDAVHRSYTSTEVSVAVGQLRQVTVLVSGEVNNPGTRIATASSTILDAILLSGGVKKSGTLRQIKLIRNGQSINVDLYGVLTRHGSAQLPNVHDGDRILVLPIGSTVAIGGYVRRPGIYELLPGKASISTTELLALGNGVVLRGTTSESILRIMPGGKTQFVDVTSQRGAQLRDGEVMLVKSAVNMSEGLVTLAGAVRTPGAFALDKYKTLHDLLPSGDALQHGAYVLFGFIDRIDRVTLQHTPLVFSPLHVIQGKENADLMSDDTVHILTAGGVRALLHHQVGLSPLQPNQQAVGGQQNSDTDEDLTDEGLNGKQGITAGKSPTTGAAPVGAGAAGSGVTGLGVAGPGGTSAALAAANPWAASTTTNAGGTAGTTTGDYTTSAGDNGSDSVANGRDDSAANGRDESASYGSDDTITYGKDGTVTYGRDESVAYGRDDSVAYGKIDSVMAAATFGKRLTYYRFSISGAVQKPGTYLVADGTTLADVLSVLGGLSLDVDLSNFEVTSTSIDKNTGASVTERHNYQATTDQLSKVAVRPYDRVTFYHVYADRGGSSVSLQGEVRYPGNYNIVRGERLSSILLRAGGLTEVAYPYGTVFLRKSVAELEGAAKTKLIQDIRSQLFALVLHPTTTSSTAPTAESVVALQSLLSQMENATNLGRVAVIADPAVLRAHPEEDVILQPSDRIVIPKRPASVSVLGEVMQPGSMVSDEAMSVEDYIDSAGGFTQFADTDRVIVVLPNGRAYVAGSSWLNFGSGRKLPPGTAIVVARDVGTLTSHQMFIDVAQIASYIATSAAALAVLATKY